MRCPACTSANIASNKLDLPDGAEASHVIRTTKEVGHPVAAGFTAIAWIGVYLWNHVRKAYRCADCDCRFDDY
jgi:hypothetical protein